jgi:hypothetical protein
MDMRALILSLLAVPAAIIPGSPAAMGEESAIAEDPAAAEPAAEPAESATAAAGNEAAEVKIPPGFRKKQRGKYTVYCRKEQVMGTRMEQEKCYDEKGLKEMELALRENQEKVDQMRRICGSMDACGGGG